MKTFIIGIIYFIILSINTSSYASSSWNGIGDFNLSWLQQHCIEEVTNDGRPDFIQIININDNNNNICDYLDWNCKVRWLYEIYVNDRLVKRGFIWKNSYDNSWVNINDLDTYIDHKYVKEGKYKICFGLSSDPALRPNVSMTTIIWKSVTNLPN